MLSTKDGGGDEDLGKSDLWVSGPPTIKSELVVSRNPYQRNP